MNKTISATLSSGFCKNIIFDLGGVLMNIDYPLTIKAFESLGVPNFDKVFSQKSQSHLGKQKPEPESLS